MERCIVTGASGLVGRELTDMLIAKGRLVQAWQRSVPPVSRRDGVEFHAFALGGEITSEMERALADASVFIHCAWDLEVATWADIERINVRGSIDWFRAAARAGVKKLIFVSSVSAYPGCQSMYGRSKLLVEEVVTGLGGVNIRPGIVHGDPSAGVYGRLWHSTNAPLVPLIDGGDQKLLTIHKNDLAEAVDRVIADYDGWAGRVVVLGHPQLVTMRELLQHIAHFRGRNIRFVRAPGAAVMLALRSAEALGLRLKFRSDSLVTLRGPDPIVDEKALARLDVPFRSLYETLPISPLRRESDALSRYMVGRSCSVDVAQRYARAVDDLCLQLSGAESIVWNAACRFMPLLACLDAGVALVDREGAVRRRLLVMFALLEATPENADRFLFRSRGVGAHALTLARCVATPFAMLIGVALGMMCRSASLGKR